MKLVENQTWSRSKIVTTGEKLTSQDQQADLNFDFSSVRSSIEVLLR